MLEGQRCSIFSRTKLTVRLAEGEVPEGFTTGESIDNLQFHTEEEIGQVFWTTHWVKFSVAPSIDEDDVAKMFGLEEWAAKIKSEYTKSCLGCIAVFAGFMLVMLLITYLVHLAGCEGEGSSRSGGSFGGGGYSGGK